MSGTLVFKSMWDGVAERLLLLSGTALVLRSTRDGVAGRLLLLSGTALVLRSTRDGAVVIVAPVGNRSTAAVAAASASTTAVLLLLLPRLECPTLVDRFRQLLRGRRSC